MDKYTLLFHHFSFFISLKETHFSSSRFSLLSNFFQIPIYFYFNNFLILHPNFLPPILIFSCTLYIIILSSSSSISNSFINLLHHYHSIFLSLLHFYSLLLPQPLSPELSSVSNLLLILSLLFGVLFAFLESCLLFKLLSLNPDISIGSFLYRYPVTNFISGVPIIEF